MSSSLGPGHRAFVVSHQRVVLEVGLEGSIKALTELSIVPLSAELKTVHLHASSLSILAVYHPGDKGHNLSFILNEPHPVAIPDPRSIKQFPEAKRRLFERVNDKSAGELAISIDGSKIRKIEKAAISTPSASHQSSKEKDVEFEPISLAIEYSITKSDLEHNHAICSVQGQYPHLFTNSISARSWLPCLDSLWERSTWELQFIVNKSAPSLNHPITVIASGELIEQVIHPSDPSKTIFHYSQPIPTSVQHIAWAIGPFVVSDLTPNRDVNPSNAHASDINQDESIAWDSLPQSGPSNQTKLHAFSLPNRIVDLHHTTDFMSNALTFLTQEYGSYPFSSYKLVFLDMFSARNSLGTTFNSAALTLHPSDLLYPPEIIDQVYETKPILVHSLASQWVGVNIIPKSPSDTWLINGLSLYITGIYFKRLWGLNEYRFKIKKDMLRCVMLDVNKPPICQPGLPDLVDTEILGFVNLKASLVLYILDRHLRRSGGGTSLGLSRVIPKIFLHAISGEMRDGRLSTNNFLRTCRKLSGNDMKVWADQWIYASGCPTFEVSTQFNRKKMLIELTLKQINWAKLHYEAEKTSWEEKCNLKPIDHFEGQMSIRIHETDGIPYEHVLDIKEHQRRYELPINTKYKRAKKTSRRYPLTNQAAEADDEASEKFTCKLWDRSKQERERWRVADWTEEEDQAMMLSTFEWIRLDVEGEWICDFRFDMKEYMWIEQLQRDKDVIAQLEAVQALKLLPSPVVASHLCKTVLTPEYFFRIRTEAVLALVSCATPQCNYLGLFHLLKLFQTQYCFPPREESKNPFDIRAIPQATHFGNLIDYFLRKAIVVALSRVRDHAGRSPSVCQQFFIDQLTYNDDSMNPYSDVHYISTLISAMSDCFMYSPGTSERDDGSELFVPQTKSKLKIGDSGIKRMGAMLSELERTMVMDRLVPSYRNLVTTAVIEANLKLMMASLLPVDIMFFLACTRPGNYPPVRILAFDCLLLLRAFQEKAIVRYMFLVMRDDPSLLVKRRLALGLVQSLPILVLMEELAVEHNKSGFSIIDDPSQVNKAKGRFDHKNVAKLLRAEVGRALILRDCIVSVMLDPNVDIDVQTCLLKLSEVLFKPSEETVPPKLTLEVPVSPDPLPEPPTATLPKIRIPAPPIVVEPQADQVSVLSPRIILTDPNQVTNLGEQEIQIISQPEPPRPLASTTSLELPMNVVPVGLIKKSKPPPKPKKFQASGMTIPDHKLCQSLLKKLASNPLGAPFRRPVDPIRQGAPDYFNIISKPMDFKTMSDKLEMGLYPDREAFRDDFNLVITNCKTYNLADSPLVVKHAEPIKVMFDKQWERSEKTMNAVQAKGIGGMGAGWMKPFDSKSILPSTNAPPLAPPPSFAAFAAGGSMIPAPPAPVSAPPAPVPAPPLRLSPDATRVPALKVILKPRTLAISGPSSVSLDSPTMPPPSSKVPLRIKLGSVSGSSPSTPSSRSLSGLQRGFSVSGPTFPAPPPPTFSVSSTPAYPAPPAPIIGVLQPTPTLPPPAPLTVSKSLPPQNLPRSSTTSLPAFPAPPPPTLESLTATPQMANPFDYSPFPRTRADAALEASLPLPQASSRPLSLSTSQPNIGTTSSSLLDPLPKKKTILTKLSKPPRPETSPVASASISSHAVAPPPALPQAIATPSNRPPSLSSTLSSASGVRPMSTPSIKIKMVKRPIDSVTPQVTVDQSAVSIPSPIVNPAKVLKVAKASQTTVKAVVGGSAPPGASTDVAPSSSFDSLPPLPCTPTEYKKGKAKKSGRQVPSHHTPGAQSLSKQELPLAPFVGVPSTSRSGDTHGTSSPSSQSAKFSNLDPGVKRNRELVIPKKAKPIIKAMLEHPDGAWFTKPVDPIRDGAPTYLEEIKHPMDLGTLLKKLDSGAYTYQYELMDDFDLMISNCIQFNGPHSTVALSAKNLEAVWWTEWEKAMKLSAKEKRALSGVLQKIAQVPGSEIFSEPVDPILLQCPDYYEVIGGKELARDLGTIKSNLQKDLYQNIEEFELDLRQMLTNCFNYNSITSPVGIIGKDVEKVFDAAILKVKKESGLLLSSNSFPSHHSKTNSSSSNPSQVVMFNKRKGNQGSGSSSKKTKFR